MTTEFTPYLAALGGTLIGVSAVVLMALFGRIAGISGIAASLLPGAAALSGATSPSHASSAAMRGLSMPPPSKRGRGA